MKNNDDSHATKSHARLYAITAIVLTIITLVELVVVPEFWNMLFGGSLDQLPNAVVVPSLFALAAVKFVMVAALFMHLKDDNRVYTLLFCAPLVIAVIVIGVLGTFAVVTYRPYSGAAPGLAADFTNRSDGYAETERMWRDSGQAREKYASAEELAAGYTAANQTGFSAGKEIYQVRCAACHRADGGGGVGPAFTDDCYKNGGTLTAMVSAVRDGIPGTAMASMRYEYSLEQIRQVTYYVRSMRGTQVDDPKACEGARYTGQ